MWVGIWVFVRVSGSHKKFVKSKILIEWINDLSYGYIVYDKVRYCAMLIVLWLFVLMKHV